MADKLREAGFDVVIAREDPDIARAYCCVLTRNGYPQVTGRGRSRQLALTAAYWLFFGEDSNDDSL